MITFEKLKKISDTLSRNNEDYFVSYINEFEGDNIFEKFKSILNSWEQDVSYELSLSTTEKSVKIQLSYILNDLPQDMNEDIIIVDNHVKTTLNIPDVFRKYDDRIPIYDMIKRIEFSNLKVDLNGLSFKEKKELLDNLPAHVYNPLIKNIINNKSKMIKLDNNILKDFNINFLSIDPYLFLKGLFMPYSSDYYKDIIYYLSKKIDGNILLNSTMMDIEYYVEKLNDESKQEGLPNLT